MSTWAKDLVKATQVAMHGAGNPAQAAGAERYMKNIAPFLGIATPQRRAILKSAWSEFRSPTSDELGEACLQLMKLREREYHYAAYDLIDKWVRQADEYFLAEYMEPLLTTTSWWDTVDGLVNAGVSPLCFRYDATTILDEWSESGNRWLIRAAIGHQRGWKKNTDVERVLQLCDQHWDDKEFFIAKAIGWALRDITRFDPSSVKRFLDTHHSKNSVAIREAERGLSRFK